MTTYTMTNEVHYLSYKRQLTDLTKVKGHVHRFCPMGSATSPYQNKRPLYDSKGPDKGEIQGNLLRQKLSGVYTHQLKLYQETKSIQWR